MNDDNLLRQTGHVLQERLGQQNEAIACFRLARAFQAAGLGLRTVPRYFRCPRMKCLLNKSNNNER